MIPENQKLPLSGDRFTVDYLLTGTEGECLKLVDSLRYEQTVEFPPDLVPPGDIRDQIVGRLESFRPSGPGKFTAGISYAVELTGFQFVQFLNVIFGNCSLFPGVRITGLELPESLLSGFEGPRFGRKGLREMFGAQGRPLLTTAIKPQGMSPRELADQTYQFALGGIDIIKDDHGLCDQPFSPFRERVELCSAAVARANRETGFRSVYMPSVNGPADQVDGWCRFAAQAGAGGLLVSPGLVGWDTLRLIAGSGGPGLPVMCHPTFLGSFVTSPDNGISHGVLFGTLSRLAGADLTVFPNYGGRFSFSREECREIADATAAPLGNLADSFPAPGGGMTSERIPEIVEFYQGEVALLVGGGLHRGEEPLPVRCLAIRKSLEGKSSRG